MDADLDRFATVPGALASFAVEIDEVGEALEPPIVTPISGRTSVGAGEGSRRAAGADPDQEAGRRGGRRFDFRAPDGRNLSRSIGRLVELEKEAELITKRSSESCGSQCHP